MGKEQIDLEYVIRAAKVLNVSVMDLLLDLDEDHRFDETDAKMIFGLHKVIAEKRDHPDVYKLVGKALIH